MSKVQNNTVDPVCSGEKTEKTLFQKLVNFMLHGTKLYHVILFLVDCYSVIYLHIEEHHLLS